MESITHSAHIKVGTPDKCEAALAYARRGRRVFPCKAGGKEPLTKRGFKDATTDEEQIRQWWKKHPGANIGTPTGEVSDTLAVDHDLYKPEAATVEELEAELGPISHTGLAIETGSGGRQYLFKYPQGSNIRNTAGLLPGVDIRGEGGYILLPPSTTQGAYRRLDNRTLADPPGRLVERLTEPNRARSGGTGGAAAPICAALDGPPILEGSRDNELTRIVGKLHDGSRSLADLEATAIEINEARCVPPLPERQVRKIARSIHRREPCKPSRSVDRGTLEELARIEEAHLWGEEWKGARWKVPRSAFVALIKAARRYGTRIPTGVRVSMSTRSLALAAAASHVSTLKAIRRLKEAGVVRKDDADRSGTKAGAFVLISPSAKLNHSPTEVGQESCEGASGKPLRSPRLRWTAPRFDRIEDEVIRTTVRRLGKTAEQIIDLLEAAGGKMNLEDLAGAVGCSRPGDLRRRVIIRIEEARVVTVEGAIVSLSPDWLEALNRERELAGELEAHDRDTVRYNLASEAYRNRHKVRTQRAPSEADLAPGREARLKQREVDKLVAQGMARRVARAAVFKDSDPFGDEGPQPDGYITELEVVPRRPDKVGGIYEHDPDCSCEWCAEELQPRYARIGGAV